jgi:hypothetical protein
MKRFWIISMAAIILCINGIAQQRAHVSFRKVDHDFKTIKEANGPVSVVFSFINTGKAPLSLQNATASCGCTTPAYTKSPVMPGDSGFVKVTFDPNGRPGSFAKEITVISNAENSPIILKISGSVTPKEAKIEDEYHYSMGSLRLESSHLSFSRIYFGTNKVGKIKVVNAGKNKMTVGFFNLPAWLKIKSSKITLLPNEKSELEFTYNTTKRNDWGFLVDYIYLSIDGKQNPNNKLTLTAEIVEDFSKLTADQKAKAPKITFENTNYNFDYVAEGVVVENNFKFTNTGKTNLIIRKVSTTCGCTTVAPQVLIIKPGESSSIKASFNTKGYKNSQTKTVTVVSNDPGASQITLWIKGIVR